MGLFLLFFYYSIFFCTVIVGAESNKQRLHCIMTSDFDSELFHIKRGFTILYSILINARVLKEEQYQSKPQFNQLGFCHFITRREI